MFLHQLPFWVVHPFDCEDGYISDDSDSDEFDILRYPAYYDLLYNPCFHHSMFATAEGVKTWLSHCVSTVS